MFEDATITEEMQIYINAIRSILVHLKQNGSM